MRQPIAVSVSSIPRIERSGWPRTASPCRRGTHTPTSSSRTRSRNTRFSGARVVEATVSGRLRRGLPSTARPGRQSRSGTGSTTRWRGSSTTSPRCRITSARGDAAVIGVGGGRDLLTALWGRSRVTGIEVNGILIDALHGSLSFLRQSRRPRRRDARSRRGAIVPEPRRTPLRRAADVAHRHVGGHRRGRVHACPRTASTRERPGGCSSTRSRPTGVFSVSRWFAPEAAVRDDEDSRPRCGGAAGSGRRRAVART